MFEGMRSLETKKLDTYFAQVSSRIDAMQISLLKQC
jgi:hypothetical protein